jgi:ribonuclease HII
MQTVAGVDEAGRGPLAGPVVAAAVVLQAGWRLPGVNDSKVLSPPVRLRLCRKIVEGSVAVGVGVVSNRVIDDVNIEVATFLAMRRAVSRLGMEPEMVLVDGIRSPQMMYPVKTIKRGDATCLTIACASIVAKVVRDKMMVMLDRLFPGYGFAKHKGYATKEHLEVLSRSGPCPIHRLTFRPVRDAGKAEIRRFPNPDRLLRSLDDSIATGTFHKTL